MERLENDSTVVIIRPDNIVETYTKDTWDQPDTPESAIAAALLIQKAVNGKNRAILSIVPSMYLKKDVVEAYHSINIESLATALVVKSFGAKLLGNIVLKFNGSSIPTKMFTKREAAEDWLKEQLQQQA